MLFHCTAPWDQRQKAYLPAIWVGQRGDQEQIIPGWQWNTNLDFLLLFQILSQLHAVFICEDACKTSHSQSVFYSDLNIIAKRRNVKEMHRALNNLFSPHSSHFYFALLLACTNTCTVSTGTRRGAVLPKMSPKQRSGSEKQHQWKETRFIF